MVHSSVWQNGAVVAPAAAKERCRVTSNSAEAGLYGSFSGTCKFEPGILPNVENDTRFMADAPNGVRVFTFAGLHVNYLGDARGCQPLRDTPGR